MVAEAGGFGQPGAGPTHAPPLQYFSLPLNDITVDELDEGVDTGGPPTVRCVVAEGAY